MGFEPTVRYKRTQHFQCCALNHLDHLSETKVKYTTNSLKNQDLIKKYLKNLVLDIIRKR